MVGPIGMNLNYVPQMQQIGSQENVANLAMQDAFLADALKSKFAPAAPMGPVSATRLPSSLLPGAFSGSSDGGYGGLGGAGRWGPGGFAAALGRGGVNPAFLSPQGGLAFGGMQAAQAAPVSGMPIAANTGPTSMITAAMQPKPAIKFGASKR